MERPRMKRSGKQMKEGRHDSTSLHESKERLDYRQLAYPRKERFSCGDRTRNPMP